VAGTVGGVSGKVGVSGGGQDADMAEDVLQLKQINTCFQQMRGIAVPQRMA
jgi:hypothetical protein